MIKTSKVLFDRYDRTNESETEERFFNKQEGTVSCEVEIGSNSDPFNGCSATGVRIEDLQDLLKDIRDQDHEEEELLERLEEILGETIKRPKHGELDGIKIIVRFPEYDKEDGSECHDTLIFILTTQQ